MIRHPEVAKKAQIEMESVIGKEQLPSLNDRPDLPYINCTLKEIIQVKVSVHPSYKSDLTC